MRIRYALEEKLLGTGGAILKSSDCINDNDSFFVLNGDTFFNIDLSNFFLSQKSLVQMSLWHYLSLMTLAMVMFIWMAKII